MSVLSVDRRDLLSAQVEVDRLKRELTGLVKWCRADVVRRKRVSNTYMKKYRDQLQASELDVNRLQRELTVTTTKLRERDRRVIVLTRLLGDEAWERELAMHFGRELAMWAPILRRP